MAKKKKKTASKKMVTNVAITKQAGADRAYYATWTWTTTHTKEYKVNWYYSTSQGTWFVGSETTSTVKNHIYTAPENATAIKVKVCPVAETHKVNKKDVAYWTGTWSSEVVLRLGPLPPAAPPTPTVTLDGFTLTAEVTNIANASKVEFEVIKDDNITLGITGCKIETGTSRLIKKVAAGGRYKVRARTMLERGNYSEWSNYSSSSGTIPSTPKEIVTIKAASETSVRLTWNAVDTAESYNVEYTTNVDYFDTSGEVQSMTVQNVTTANVTGLETGQTWYFRLQAENEAGQSGWSPVKSCAIGTVPSPPTTWSSSTTVVGGDTVTLNWVHNSEDNSAQTGATLIIKINSNTQTINLTTETSYSIDTDGFLDNSTILWQVRTKGITDAWSDYSTQRQIKVYAPVTLGISGLGYAVSEFPIIFDLSTEVSSQTPLSYNVTIKANSSYETVNYLGESEYVVAGQEIFSRTYDTSANPFTVRLSAGDLNLDNGAYYTLTATVAVSSGLSSSVDATFRVRWEEEAIDPNAEIGISDEESASVYIRPFCSETDDISDLVEGVTLSVYRREFDGQLTEIMTGIQNDGKTVVVDPHPSLDYARYRIVSIDDDTGAVGFYDVPGYPIGETAILIQWDEEWQTFDVEGSEDDEQYEREEVAYSGSLLRLPYNIDVSEKNSLDVSLTEYIGRRHPVSYYGTQVGQSATWNVEIAADDAETIYALRRLSVWRGDAYVREPSGAGYWAQINVSFKQTHRKMVIPVTLDLTRVEGGA